MRLAVLALLLAAASLTPVLAESALSPVVALSVSPVVAGGTTPRVVRATGLQPSTLVLIVLLDPSGAEMVLQPSTDGNGALNVTLAPPASGWGHGWYRVVVSQGQGRAVSALFVVGDGGPGLAERPDLPSPWSAFNIVGSGLPANANVDLTLTLPAERGTYQFHGRTDDNGILSTYVWPEQVGVPFFEAGYYSVSIPTVGLTSSFVVREHPVGPGMSIPTVISGKPVSIQFGGYQPNRYLWGIYASPDGAVLGEFLVGVTNSGGLLQATVNLGDLAPGDYLMATPDDWGESSFMVLAPASTPTATPTPRPTPATRRPHICSPPKRTSRTTCPYVGATRSSIERAWQPLDATGRGHCSADNLVCDYTTPGVGLIQVFYGGGRHGNGAVEIDIGEYDHPGAARYWTFLTSLLPPGSARSTCRRLTHAGEPILGPAKACQYRHSGRSILLAQDLTGDAHSTVLGIVKLNGRIADLAPTRR